MTRSEVFARALGALHKHQHEIAQQRNALAKSWRAALEAQSLGNVEAAVSELSRAADLECELLGDAEHTTELASALGCEIEFDRHEEQRFEKETP